MFLYSDLCGQNFTLATSLFLYIHSNFIKIKKAFIGCKINMK